jgi:iron complex outermembrane recepter protein
MTRTVFSRFLAVSGVSALALSASLAWVQSTHAAEAAKPASVEAKEVEEIIVTAPVGRAADVAPVKASLTTTEPQAVITRKFIEESAPRVGDFTTTVILAPSMVTTPNPNGSGATDGAKLSMRGFQDGEYNITYDGIAWGDTNGPSHHSNSFFPSSTIGGVVVNRGPGNATDLGQANFGGSVNLFSLPFEDKFTVRQTVTVGSYGTSQSVTTLGTGPIKALHDANFVMNVMGYKTDGYLTNSPSDGLNEFFKATLPVNDRVSLTALFTHNYNTYNQSDSVTPATLAQTLAYGKRFSLSLDPTLQTYKDYNFTKKQTDFGYLRANVDFGSGLTAENTAYSYWYSNKTLSAANGAADNTLGAVALAAANKVILTRGAAYPIGGSGYSSSLKVNGIPGYSKRNEYRVRGDILKFDKDFATGKATFGVMYEMAKTSRSRFDFDWLTFRPDYREKAATIAGKFSCNGLPTTVAPGKTYNGACQVPLDTAYNEYSGWHQYQTFAQYEWKPNDKLTVTPGVKHVNFELYVRAPALAVKGSIQPADTSSTYTATLPFMTANYRIQPNWTVYGQYAQGFLVPSIGVFYVNAPGKNKVEPQRSTNYQLGTVYNSGNVTIDADIYYIDFKNKIQSVTDVATNETYQTNLGGATYKGFEGQVTYVWMKGFSTFANLSLNSAEGKNDPYNSGYNGHQLPKTPFWTGAAGARYQKNGLFTPEDSLVTTLNEKIIGPQFANGASGATGPSGRILTFDQADLSATYNVGRYSLEVQLLNLQDRQDMTSFKGSALIPGTNLPAETLAQGGGANIFTYQTGRSYQVTLKAVF